MVIIYQWRQPWRSLNLSGDDAFLISAGNLFHEVEVATPDAYSPYHLSPDTGTLSFQDDILMDKSSHR